MLANRLDVSYYAPQTMAFGVDAAKLLAVRDALRAVVERADLGPLIRCWEAEAPAYRRARLTARWSVPRHTLEQMCAQAERFATELRPDEQRAATPEEIREELRQAIARAHASLPAGERFIAHPDRWFWLESAYAPLVTLGPGSPDSAAWISFFTQGLDHLWDPGEPQKHEVSPAGDISFLIGVRCFRQGTDSEITFEEADLVCDEARWNDGQPQVSDLYSLYQTVRERCTVDAVLEAIVGPFVLTQGPGPFLPAPSTSAPLIDPTWDLLPVFRAGREVWAPATTTFLIGEALDAAITEVSSQAPHRWWTQIDALDEWSPKSGPWATSWEELVATWQPYRDRFLRLLRSARADGRAVILSLPEIGELGPGGMLPLAASGGEPAKSLPSVRDRV